jgi:hypothetical protein
MNQNFEKKNNTRGFVDLLSNLGLDVYYLHIRGNSLRSFAIGMKELNIQ